MGDVYQIYACGVIYWLFCIYEYISARGNVSFSCLIVHYPSNPMIAIYASVSIDREVSQGAAVLTRF